MAKPFNPGGLYISVATDSLMAQEIIRPITERFMPPPFFGRRRWACVRLKPVIPIAVVIFAVIIFSVFISFSFGGYNQHEQETSLSAITVCCLSFQMIALSSRIQCHISKCYGWHLIVINTVVICSYSTLIIIVHFMIQTRNGKHILHTFHYDTIKEN